jgi:hypothetical protein
MRNCTVTFQEIAREIGRIDALREAVMSKAFVELESQHAALALMLLHTVGDRQKAVRWMYLHQRIFGGRTAYDVLADGDEDAVWEAVSGMGRIHATDIEEHARLAY